MIKTTADLLVLVIVTSCGRAPSSPRLLSICELSRDFGTYRDKLIAVRGVYYHGLRQNCPARCVDGPLPSFLELIDENSSEAAALNKILLAVELKAKQGRRFEIWVTVIGKLRTMAPPAPLLRCDKIGNHYYGYGHLGQSTAELVVAQYKDIQVREDADSTYDYSRLYRGPA